MNTKQHNGFYSLTMEGVLDKHYKLDTLIIGSILYIRTSKYTFENNMFGVKLKETFI